MSQITRRRISLYLEAEGGGEPISLCQGCVQYVFTFCNVQLNGNGAVMNDQLKNGGGVRWWVVSMANAL